MSESRAKAGENTRGTDSAGDDMRRGEVFGDRDRVLAGAAGVIDFLDWLRIDCSRRRKAGR